MRSKRLAVVVVMICLAMPLFATQSTTESECWPLLDQASAQLTTLSELLQSYKHAYEQQDAVLEETVMQAVEAAREPLLVRIADLDEQMRAWRQRTVIAGTAGVTVGIVAGVVLAILIARRTP